MRAMDPSPSAPAVPELWTRAEAIRELREALVKLCGEGRSMCREAADRGIFCRGFRQWPEREFHDLWKPLIGASTHLSRAQMERFADIWQLSEQVRQGQALACDAQVIHPGACRGWDEFSNVDLSRHCAEILGRRVVVSDGQPITIGIAPESRNALDTDRDERVSLIQMHQNRPDA
jgi:hypothetical protein